MDIETALQTLRQPRLENPAREVTAFCVEADSYEHELARMLQREGVLSYKRTLRLSTNFVLYRLNNVKAKHESK